MAKKSKKVKSVPKTSKIFTGETSDVMASHETVTVLTMSHTHVPVMGARIAEIDAKHLQSLNIGEDAEETEGEA